MTDHTDRSTEALLARKTLAEEATPGPWKNHMAIRRGYGVTAVLSSDGATIADMENSEFPTEDADAAHIAANDPQTIMADIDEILRLRAEVERLEKEADWLAATAANNGWYGERVSPEWMREAARKAVEKQTCPKN